MATLAAQGNRGAVAAVVAVASWLPTIGVLVALDVLATLDALANQHASARLRRAVGRALRRSFQHRSPN